MRACTWLQGIGLILMIAGFIVITREVSNQSNIGHYQSSHARLGKVTRRPCLPQTCRAQPTEVPPTIAITCAPPLTQSPPVSVVRSRCVHHHMPTISERYDVEVFVAAPSAGGGYH